MFDLDNDNEEDLLEENNHDIDTNNKIINDEACYYADC